MAWLGEGLSTLRGQITSVANFTKEVLSDVQDDKEGGTAGLGTSNHTIQELEEYCALKDLETANLRERCKHLEALVASSSQRFQSQSLDQSISDDGGVECLSAESWNQHELQSTSLPGASLLQGQTTEVPKNYVLVPEEKEVTLMRRIDHLEAENKLMRKTCFEYEEQVAELLEQRMKYGSSTSEESTDLGKLGSDLHPVLQRELSQEDLPNMYREQLLASECRVAELETALQMVQRQLLAQLGDTEASASAMRGAVHETRLQLMAEPSGDQQHRKHVADEMRQLAEKRNEAEAQLKILTKKQKLLSADVINIIAKIGDAEQQEFIHGALNAMELENQILKIRNAQLELAAGSVQEGIDSDRGFKGDHFEIAKDFSLEDVGSPANDLSEELETLRVAKQCLSTELESMATLVQNLEASHTHLQEENAALSTNLEELDQQHQVAVDQLLHSKKAVQIENNALNLELQELKLKLSALSRQLETVHPASVPPSAEAATETADLDTNLLLEAQKAFENEFYANVLKLIPFELPKEYHNNKKYDLDSTSLVKMLVKSCEESRWKKDTLERKVAELMKDLREKEKLVQERDDRILLLEEETGILKSSNSSDILAVIPENSEDVELLEQRALGLDTELTSVKNDRERLSALVDQLQNDAITTSNRLQQQELLVKDMKSKLEEALNCQAELAKEKMSLIDQARSNSEIIADRENLQSECSKLQLLLDETRGLLADGEASKQQWERKAVLQESKLAELQKELEDARTGSVAFEQAAQNEVDALRALFATEREELQNSVSNVSEKLNAALEANAVNDAACERWEAKAKILENTVGSLNEKISFLSEEIQHLKTVDGERLQFKKIISEKQLEHTEYCNKADATITQLKNQLRDLTKEKSDLEAVNLRLEAAQGLSFDNSALQNEVEKWRGMATASERQLDEALQARSELEDECKRLFAIETKVQRQEHLEREIAQLTEVTRTTEVKLNDALQSKEELEQKLQHLKSSLDEQKGLEQEAKEWRETNSATEHKLQDMLAANSKLSAELSRLKDIEACYSKNLGAIEILEHQLNNVVVKNTGLEEKLEIATGHLKRLQHLDQEILEWKEKARVSESQLKEALMRKHEVEKENKDLLESVKNTNIEKRDQEKQDGLDKSDDNSRNEPRRDVAQQSFQSLESAEMARETVANLSKIIKEKDLELQAMSLKCESLVKSVQQESKASVGDGVGDSVRSEVSRLQSENDELIRTVQLKQQECLSYYSEIQRLSSLLNNELAKSEQMINMNLGLKQQYDDKQKLLFNTQNELIAVKQRLDILEQVAGSPQRLMQVENQTPDITSLEAKNEVIAMKTQLAKELGLELKAREDEIFQLKERIIELQNSKFGSRIVDNQIATIGSKEQDSLVQELQAERLQLLDTLQQETTRNKYLQSEIQEQHEKETSLSKELNRLREHLVSVEDTYTQETINNEESMKELKLKLMHAEDQIKNCSTAYTSANIRANQHLESLQDQARVAIQHRDDMQVKLSATEDQMHKHAAALRNLQGVLEQFQNDKQMDIVSETSKLQQQMQWLNVKNGELSSEVATLHIHLAEAQEGLKAASRLGEQLDKKSETIAGLKEEVQRLNEQLNTAETREKSASQSNEGKIDKYLTKNLLIGYLVSPEHTKLQALRIVAQVLDFNQDERGRVGLEPGVRTTSWFSSLMHPGSGSSSNQSLSEAFVRFLESESRPQPQLRLLPAIQDTPQAKLGVEPAAGSHTSPILLTEVQLPTFTQFPVPRNSSSILKDVLKDC